MSSLFDADRDYLLIRRAVAADVPYITSSWLNGYKGAAANWGIRTQEYYYYNHKLLEDLLPRSTTLVLCNKENPDLILGFICFQSTASGILFLHWVNLKGRYRGNGLGRKMVETVIESEKPSQVIWTYRTKLAADIIKGHQNECGSWRHNPFYPVASAAPNWAKAHEQAPHFSPPKTKHAL